MKSSRFKKGCEWTFIHSAITILTIAVGKNIKVWHPVTGMMHAVLIIN